MSMGFKAAAVTSFAIILLIKQTPKLIELEELAIF
jgi:hypothetical protein